MDLHIQTHHSPWKEIPCDTQEFKLLDILHCSEYITFHRAYYNGVECVIKSLNKAMCTSDQMKHALSEIFIVTRLDHPNIVKVYGVIENDLYIYIIHESWTCTLYEYLIENNMTEGTAVVEIAEPMLQVSKYLEEQRIVHRDINPCTICLTTDNAWKLCHFDKSIDVSSFKLRKTYGLRYNSPENKDYRNYSVEDHHRIDVWNIGLLVSEILTKEVPSMMEDESYPPPLKHISCLSTSANDFIQKALSIDVSSRPSSHELIGHPWICEHCDSLGGRIKKSQSVPVISTKCNKVGMEAYEYSKEYCTMTKKKSMLSLLLKSEADIGCKNR